MIGRQIQVGIAKETARGTVAVPTFWIPKEDVSIDDSMTYENNDESFGIITDSSDAVIVKQMSEGEIKGKVRDKSFGLILLGALGTVASAVKETTAYNHTFTLAQTNIHQSLTVEIKNAVEQVSYALAMVKSLKINVQVEKFVEYAVTLMAKKGATSSNTPAYVTENEFVAKHATMKLASNIAGLAGVSAIPVRSIELSIDKGLNEEMAIGSIDPIEIYNQEFKVEGNIEAEYKDLATFKTAYEAGTLQALQLIITNPSVTIGASSAPTIVITLAKVSLQDLSVSGGNKDIVKQTIKFKGHYSLADSKMLDIVLTNTQTSY
jgi:hypothetical protein